jgi:hypothetical protein
MIPFLIAGGAFIGAVTQPEPELINHTLRGERIPANQVVCRTMWGTPMLPDGKGGYSVIAPINQKYIDLSLIQPPITDGTVYRPITVTITEATVPIDAQ